VVIQPLPSEVTRQPARGQNVSSHYVKIGTITMVEIVGGQPRQDAWFPTSHQIIDRNGVDAQHEGSIVPLKEPCAKGLYQVFMRLICQIIVDS